MANYWQMTLAELDQESVQPIRKLFHFGCYHFNCPICDEVVGIWRDPNIDNVVGIWRDPNIDKVTNGMIWKRDECKHGHAIDWSNVKEVE